jgi:tetratricopeptide (TPR) repeat protein
MNQPQIHWTPLAVITLFVGLIDTVLVFNIPKTTGGIQIALTVFVFIFTFLFFVTFIFFLWKKPYLLYSPRDWGETPKLQDYVRTISGSSPKQVETETERINEIGTFSEELQMALETQEKQENQEQQVEEPAWWKPFRNGKYDEARQHLNDKIAKADDRHELLILRAMSTYILSLSDFYSSVAEYQKLINDYPNDIAPYRAFAKAYERTSQYAKAIEILDQGISYVSKDNKILLKLQKLSVFTEEGKQEILPDAKKLTTDISTSSKNPQHIAEAYRILGSFYSKFKLWDKAKKVFILAFNSAPADLENLEEIANHFRDKVEDYKTELYFRTLVFQIVPQREISLVLLGNCHLMLNQYDLAYQRYKAAHQNDNEVGAWVYSNLGNLYRVVGLYTLGKSSLETALQATPDDTYSHERMSEAISAAQTQLEKSEAIFNSVKNEIATLSLELDDPISLEVPIVQSQ